MSLILGDRVLDNGLAALDTECDKIFVCSSAPTTYTEATSTFALGNKNFGVGSAFGAPAAGSPDGRKVTSVAITDGTITANGTVGFWAAVDSVNSRLLANDAPTGGIAVTSGWVFTLGAIPVHIPGSASVSSFDPTTLFSSNTGGWWDVSDHSTTFQDTAGTTPANAANDPVARINDKSGNGNNLLQATSGARPLLKNSGGLWWLECDGSDDSLRAVFTISQPFTCIDAVRNITFITNAYIYDGGNQNGSCIQTTGTTPNIDMYSGLTLSSSALTVGVDHVITAIFETQPGPPYSRLGVDNGSYVTGADTGNNVSGGRTVGRDGAQNQPAANIRWFGGIDIGRVLTDPEIASCKTFFGAKAGLTL